MKEMRNEIKDNAQVYTKQAPINRDMLSVLSECRSWIVRNKPIYIFGGDADDLIKKIDSVVGKRNNM